jgi:hypothetical protein
MINPKATSPLVKGCGKGGVPPEQIILATIVFRSISNFASNAYLAPLTGCIG